MEIRNKDDKALYKNVDKCPKCLGTGVVVKSSEDGTTQRLICACRGIAIAKRMLGKLFPFFDPSKKANRDVSLSPKMNKKSVFAFYKKGEIPYKKILSLIFFRKKIAKFEMLDAYRLMEMYLGKDEEYASPRDLINKNQALVVRLGQTEMKVGKFDEIVKMTLLLAVDKPNFIIWVVSPYPLSSPYLKDFYEKHTLPVLKGDNSVFEAVIL